MKDIAPEGQRTNHRVNCGENDPPQESTAADNALGCGAKVQSWIKRRCHGFWTAPECRWCRTPVVVVKLRVPDLHHVQNNLGTLGIILVPAVMKGFAGAGQ